VVAGQFSDLNQSTEFLAQDHKKKGDTKRRKTEKSREWE
jgi:hypothetical protein